ncbi:hypothetical protein HDU82_008545 [Entophlyctis luteolus]|nr:hypothetical protein HDU82_008545 [Entophlyctis luteolus]
MAAAAPSDDRHALSGFEVLASLDRTLLFHPECIWLDSLDPTGPLVPPPPACDATADSTVSAGLQSPLLSIADSKNESARSVSMADVDLNTAKGRDLLRTIRYREFINSASESSSVSSLKKIPDRFPSSNGFEHAFASYLSAFKIPLLEESRAQIASKANLFQKSTSAFCSFYRVDVKAWGAKNNTTNSKNVEDADDPCALVDDSAFEYVAPDKIEVDENSTELESDYSAVTINLKNYSRELKVGDIILISEVNLSDPQIVDEIKARHGKSRNSYGTSFSSSGPNAEIEGNDDDLRDYNLIVEKVGILLVLHVTPRPNQRNRQSSAYCCVYQLPKLALKPSQMYVSEPLSTAIPLNRVYESLSDVNPRRLHSENLQKAILEGNFDYAQKVYEASSSGSRVAGLNHSQQRAHDAALATVKHSGICLIQGPPGTGKTKTVSSIMKTIMSKGDTKVLQCSPTNTAMIQVAERLLQELKAVPSKITSDPSAVVVLGHRDKVKELCNPAFHQYCAEIRVELVAKCALDLAEGLAAVIDDSDNVSTTFSNSPNSRKKGKRSGEGKNGTHNPLAPNWCSYQTSESWDLFKVGKLDSMWKLTLKYVSKMKKLCGERLLEVDLPLIEPFATIDSFAQLLGKYQSDGKYAGNGNEIEREFDAIFPLARRVVKKTKLFVAFDKFGDLDRRDTNKKKLVSALHSIFVKKALAVFSTLSGTYSVHMKENDSFGVVIVDEAGQAAEADTTCILKPSVRALILVGDTKQLQSTVMSNACETAGFGRSLAERLESLGHRVYMLEIQYRMHPAIAEFSSNVIYDGWLTNSDCVHGYHQQWYNDSEFPVMQFVAHNGTFHSKDSSGSITNEMEARLICKRLSKFLSKFGNRKISIGIICPYKSQKSLLEQMISALPPHNLIISVNTVDGFQGQERDLIVLSLTRVGHISGFLDDLRRVNVALTRARYNLWVYGDFSTYSNSLGQFGSFGWFFDFCNKRGYVRKVNAMSALSATFAADSTSGYSDDDNQHRRRIHSKESLLPSVNTLISSEKNLLDAWSAAFG